VITGAERLHECAHAHRVCGIALKADGKGGHQRLDSRHGLLLRQAKLLGHALHRLAASRLHHHVDQWQHFRVLQRFSSH
jgi:hypothetical protein